MSTNKTSRQAASTLPDESANLYELRRPLQEQYTRRLADLLRQLLESASIDVHAIENRTKTLESFKEKIKRSGKHYVDPMQEITDLSGIRIIVYYGDDVNAVCRLMKREFAVDEENSSDSRTIIAPDEFGYQSAHYVIGLGSARSRLSEWDRFKEMVAEIQVRTVLQHAWAAISHKLAYKREIDVPLPLRRKLSRLSALLELGDEEFQSLRDNTAAFLDRVATQISDGATDIHLDAVSLQEYFSSAPELNYLSDAGKKAGFNVDTETNKYVSDVLALLSVIGIDNLAELKDLLAEANEWAEGFLKHLTEGAMSWTASLSFFVALVIIGRYFEQLSTETLVKIGWNSDIAEHVMNRTRSFKISQSANGRSAAKQDASANHVEIGKEAGGSRSKKH